MGDTADPNSALCIHMIHQSYSEANNAFTADSFEICPSFLSIQTTK